MLAAIEFFSLNLTKKIWSVLKLKEEWKGT